MGARKVIGRRRGIDWRKSEAVARTMRIVMTHVIATIVKFAVGGLALLVAASSAGCAAGVNPQEAGGSPVVDVPTPARCAAAARLATSHFEGSDLNDPGGSAFASHVRAK